MEFDQLIKHMSPGCRDLFEQAVAGASSRSHHAMDVVHWLTQGLEAEDPELLNVYRHFDLRTEGLGADLTAALERLPTGNDGFPRIAPDVARLLFEGWMLASSEFQCLEIRPAHLLLALIGNDTLRLKALRLSSEFGKLHAEELRSQCLGLLQGRLAETAAGPQGSTHSPALDQFTIDLTAQARAGRIDPVLGRDQEIRQMIDILCRRRQNNPILTGEAGVGKTAVVEGLAQRIVRGDVPESLRPVALRTLDMGLLQAGAGVKGEFENRLKNVIKEVQAAPNPVILFIDEAHTLIGAGNQSGAGDAANLLKPALARGELRTIAATTWAEYKKYFETDAALTRRFQVVKVEEPGTEQATVMLRSLAATLEEHHQVAILDEAIQAAVTLSQRYIAGRQLPDKGVSLLDTACARVSLSHHTTPPALERCHRRLADLETELARLEAESRTGADHEAAIVERQVRRSSLQAQAAALEERWQQARELIERIGELRRRLDAAGEAQTSEDEAAQDLRQALRGARAQLQDLHGESPLLYECVDAQVVAEVVADWTGIPVGRMQSDQIETVLGLAQRLEERVVGQDHALELIARSMQTARAGLNDPRRPLGVFMLVGPSGIGKTETALALAEQLYGSDRAITVINMSEFKEEHKVSLLMGSPPGYVGYGEGGLLTEAVRRKPYSVVLLDEIEKAHPGVQDIFYQVFDKGVLRDGEGRDVDFRNTVIIMTSNTASEQIEQLCADPDTAPQPERLIEAIGPSLRQTYKPAFLGRITLVPYYPLDEPTLGRIARLQLRNLQQRVRETYKVPLHYSEALLERIIDRCQRSDSGGRQIAGVINQSLLPELSRCVLEQLTAEREISEIILDADAKGFSFKIVNPEGTQKMGAGRADTRKN